MTELNKAALAAVLRLDICSFAVKCLKVTAPDQKYVHNWHHDALGHLLSSCFQGECKRGLITMPPRELKTHFISVSFCAFVLGHKPSTSIIVASYNRELAESFLYNVKLILEADWYQELFPHTKLRKSTESEIKTMRNGSVLATSVNSTVTGKGADFIIVDDPHNVREAHSDTIRQSTIDWFRSSLISRTNDSAKACFIVVQQRVHPSDLAGYLIDQGGWEHLNLPAIADTDQKIPISENKTILFKKGELLNPTRLSIEILEQKKLEMGALDFSSQFLQAPVTSEGNIIPVNKFRTFDWPDLRMDNGVIIQAWDLAFSEKSTSDYSVGTTWLVENRAYYLLDVYREKGSYEKTKEAIIELARRHDAARVLIERNGIGEGMVSELRNASIPAEGVNSTLSKESRAQPCTAQIERGEVYLPETAIWKDTLIEECRVFPNGKHDDQVDSLTLFLNAMREYMTCDQEADEFLKNLKKYTELSAVKQQLDQTRYHQRAQGDWLLPALDKKYPGWRG